MRDVFGLLLIRRNCVVGFFKRLAQDHVAHFERRVARVQDADFIDHRAIDHALVRALDEPVIIDARKAASVEWRVEQLARIQQAAKPTADLVLAVAPAVQKLVEGSADASTTP